MPDSDRDDHWDFLAADLGASPTPDEETREEEPESSTIDVEPDIVEESSSDPSAGEVDEADKRDAAGVMPETPQKRQRGRQGDRVVSGFSYRRGAVDWANLAQELGVEAMEEVPAPIPAADAPSESEASTIFDPEPVGMDGAELEVAEEEVTELEVESLEFSSEQADPASEPAIGGFGAGLIDDLGPEVTTPAQDEVGDADEPQEERKGRRRRHRRKPRKQESDQEQPVEAAIVEEAETEVESPSQEEEHEEEGSSRRRGHRRGGRKRKPREEKITESAEFGEGLGAGESDQNDSEDFEIFEAEDYEEVESSEGQRPQGERSKDGDQDKKSSKKVTHRGIPTWDEAVGHIIDSNMESRSKKPESSGSRQRPGRRRGGDRSGNRGR